MIVGRKGSWAFGGSIAGTRVTGSAPGSRHGQCRSDARSVPAARRLTPLAHRHRRGPCFDPSSPARSSRWPPSARRWRIPSPPRPTARSWKASPIRSRCSASRFLAAPDAPDGLSRRAGRETERPHRRAAPRQEFLRRHLGEPDPGARRGRLPGDRARSDRLLQVEQAGRLPVHLPAARREHARAAGAARGGAADPGRSLDRRHAGRALRPALPEGCGPLVLVNPVGLEDWSAKGLPPVSWRNGTSAS